MALALAFLPAAAQAAPPANDDFANAELISGANTSVNGNLTDSTLQAGEPAGDFGSTFDGSVWYRWTAPSTGLLTGNASGTNTGVGIYTGSAVDALTWVAGAYNAISANVSQGTSYYIAVARNTSTPAAAFTLNLNLQVAGPVPNDNFADAQVISGADVTVGGTLLGSTTQAGEPAEGFSLTKSVWYEWTAPGNATVELRVSGGLGIGAYTGTAHNSLVVAQQNFATITFNATGGTTYKIGVAGGNTAGAFSLSLKQFLPPANDNFASSELVSGFPATAGIETRGATSEAGEPDHGNSFATATAWYRWVAPGSANVIFRYCDQSSGSNIAVYTGTALNDLTEVARGTCRMMLSANSGMTYWIAVASQPSFARQFTLHLREWNPPANDDFSNAEVITGIDQVVDGNLVDATVEPNEPQHSGFEPNSSVWFTWTAPQSGTTTVEACAEFERVSNLEVYTGGTLETLTQVGSGQCQVTFEATSGVTYAIAPVANFADAGPFTLWVGPTQPPANDNFANAQTISGFDQNVSANLLGSTLEVDDPVERLHQGWFEGTIWYRWVAPVSTGIRVSLSRSDGGVGIFTGTAPANLVEAGTSWFGSSEANVTAGVTYWIGLARADDLISRVTLSLSERDIVAPDTAIDSGPSGPHDSTQATFTFSGTPGDTAKFECRVDSGPIVDCTSPYTLTGLSQGDHQLLVRAVDLAGNRDPSPAARTFSVDTVAPVVTITSGTSGSSTASFEFGSSEAGVSFQCRLDSGSFQACTSPVSFSGLSNGAHSFEVTGTDPAGNQSAAPASRSWTTNTGSNTATTSGVVPVGGTISTDPTESGPTAAQPATASITVPGGGEVTVVQKPADVQAPAGFRVIGQQFNIEAPPGTVQDPLVLTFRIDASALPEDYLLEELTMLRDGVAIVECTVFNGTATPDPCIAGSEVLDDGDVVLTVLSSHASTWNVAVVKVTEACKEARKNLTKFMKSLTRAKAAKKSATKKITKATKAVRLAKRRGNAANVRKANKGLKKAKKQVRKASSKARSLNGQIKGQEKRVKKICSV